MRTIAIAAVSVLLGVLGGCEHQRQSNAGKTALSAALVHSAEGDIAPFLGEPRFELQPIFEGERFGNVVVTTKGTVIATWAQENYRLRRSEDGGTTWGPEIHVGKGIHGGGVTVDETTGKIFVFIEEKHPPAPQEVFVSSDDGKTWRKIKDVVIKPDALGNTISMSMCEAGITLRGGAFAGRLLRPARFYKNYRDRSKWGQDYNSALYSDDGGTTWIPSAPFPELGTGEGSVVELSDGTVLYDSRVHWPERPSPTKRRFAWSDDGGQTWRDWRIMDILPDGPQDMVYGLMGGLTRLPVAGRDILLFSNVENEHSEPYTYRGNEIGGRFCGRRFGTVWVSFDGGHTWPLKRLVHEGPFAYSSLVAGRPKTASEGWVYLQFEGGPSSPHADSQIARFNLSWLLGGELTGDGQLPDWIVR